MTESINIDLIFEDKLRCTVRTLHLNSIYVYCLKSEKVFVQNFKINIHKCL